MGLNSTQLESGRPLCAFNVSPSCLACGPNPDVLLPFSATKDLCHIALSHLTSLRKFRYERKPNEELHTLIGTTLETMMGPSLATSSGENLNIHRKVT